MNAKGHCDEGAVGVLVVGQFASHGEVAALLVVDGVLSFFTQWVPLNLISLGGAI